MTTEKVHVALVLNGGVSLAVWMGGVVHEVDRLRRSGTGPGPAPPPPESEAWRAICTAAGREIRVDLVSGTSAGGLNGAILATAISAGSPLPQLEELWASSAQLDQSRLLSTPLGIRELPAEVGQPVDGPELTPRPSVLNGAWFEQRIKDQLDSIAPGTDHQDVTLLVTASALGTSGTAVKDAIGREFRAGDHRRVYRFRKQATAYSIPPGAAAPEPTEGGVDEFDTYGDALIRAARASAGFPVAFEPVWERGDLATLNQVPTSGGPSWLVDGGVLDNTPFVPLVKELRANPRTEPGDRWIIYVVPTVGHDAERPPPAQPPAWTSLPGVLLGLSRESDARDDVEILKQHWEASNSAGVRPEALLGGSDLPLDVPGATTALFELYRRTKAAQLVQEFRETLAQDNLAAEPVTQAMIDSLLAIDCCWIPETALPSRPMDGVSSWQWGVGAAWRMVGWIRRQARDAGNPTLAEEAATVEAQLDAISARLHALEVSAVDGANLVNGAVERSMGAYLASGLLGLVETLMNTIVEAWATTLGVLPPASAITVAWDRLIFVEVLMNTASWQTSEAPSPFALYIVSPDSDLDGTTLDPADTPPLLDRNLWPGNKLYGTRFGHFAAFGKTEWRRWDWRWGRIDGAVTLARALLDTPAVTPEQRTDLIDDLIAEILGPTTLPAVLLAEAQTVALLTPGELVAMARDSNATDFDLVLTIAGNLLENSPILNPPPADTLSGRIKQKATRLVARLGLRWLKERLSKAIQRQQ